MRSARATGSKQRAHAGYLRRCYPTVEDASEKMQEENSQHLWPISAASDAADVIRFSESHSHA